MIRKVGTCLYQVRYISITSRYKNIMQNLTFKQLIVNKATDPCLVMILILIPYIYIYIYNIIPVRINLPLFSTVVNSWDDGGK